MVTNRKVGLSTKQCKKITRKCTRTVHAVMAFAKPRKAPSSMSAGDFGRSRIERTDMPTPLDTFGKTMMEMRDLGIGFYDMLADGKWKAPALQALQQELVSLPAEARDTTRKCVVRTLDNAIHGFLFAIQEAHDRDSGLAVMVDGIAVASESDGLQGEPYGSNGWTAKFSRYPEEAE